MLELTDVWSSNAEEAEELLRAVGQEPPTDLAELTTAIAPLLRGDAVAIVRDGPEGCAVHVGGETTYVAGFPQTPVDTNGAGDTHTGALLAEVAAGTPWVEGCRRANAAAAIKVTRRGPQSAPTAAEVDEFLAASMTPDVLLIGCGDLGARGWGCPWRWRGLDVLALRRNADRVPAPLHGSLRGPHPAKAPDLAGLRPRFVVVALTARPRTEDAYRATYVDGMAAGARRPRGGSRAGGAGVLDRRARQAATGPRSRTSRLPPTRPTDRAGCWSLPRRSSTHASRMGRCCGSRGCTAGTARGCSTWSVRNASTTPTGGPTASTGRTRQQRSSTSSRCRPHLRPVSTSCTDDEPALDRWVMSLPTSPASSTYVPLRPADPAQGHGKRLSNARLRSTGWWPTGVELPPGLRGRGGVRS